MNRLPVEVFHDHIRPSLVLSGVVNGNDVRMLQLGCRFNFRLESRQRLVVENESGTDEFNRFPPFESQILRFVDVSHAASSQKSNQTVLADRQGHLKRRIVVRSLMQLLHQAGNFSLKRQGVWDVHYLSFGVRECSEAKLSLF